jgi:intracellular sulfur oxidation DsrE/DsrF family protein
MKDLNLGGDIMKMLSKAALMAAGVAVAASANAVDPSKPAKNGYNQQKVVYHINNIHSAKGALRNLKNHLNALGDENIEAIVVTHSSGGFAMVDGAMGKKDKKGKPYNFSDQIASLANRGVKFTICANTIRGKKIPKDKINENAEIIPSGVAHVAHLQQKGYIYVKP